ncbi:hypothetical protein F2P79_014235 [Pimephales promelas]|nr:hypothetical protein F2P79_014235 [Pimephales promelas]
MRAPGSRTPSLPLHRQEGGDKQLVSDAVIRPPARAVFHTNKRLSRSHYRKRPRGLTDNLCFCCCGPRLQRDLYLEAHLFPLSINYLRLWKRIKREPSISCDPVSSRSTVRPSENPLTDWIRQSGSGHVTL